MSHVRNPEKPTIMIFGMGNLSTNLLPFLLMTEMTSQVVIAGRNDETTVRRVNLGRFTAHNFGIVATPTVTTVDLHNVDQTAEALHRAKPTIVFMGASLQAARIITELPAEIFRAVDEAQFGPWLPMHLTLAYNLMVAVERSGLKCKVVNSAFPDAVGPVLAKVGLAPTIGVGNVGNIIPALTYSVANSLGVVPTRVEIKLVAHHYFSHYVHRFGDSGRGHYHLSAFVDGELVRRELDQPEIFSRLTGPLKRVGGTDGQVLTASSAAKVIQALTSDKPVSTHAPAPHGHPGGYPVKINERQVETDLAPSITLDEAIKLNERCQLADGIENIDQDGTVTFAEREMAIMNKLFKYQCRQMKLEDAAGRAEELGRKYQEFRRNLHLAHA